MDPNHVACYAQAQVELRELFHELACNGQASAAELQRSLVPFTAGDVKRDLLELLAELKGKRQSLDEAEFLRVMWRKMYLTSAIDATKSGAAGQRKPINVSLAHVIVSVKRRQQLRQFASYYARRGISGSDRLMSPSKGTTSVKSGNTSPKVSPFQSLGHKELSPPLQQAEREAQSSTDKNGFQASSRVAESVVALRRRCSPCYDVVACVFDADLRQMRTRTLFTRARSAEVRNCSRLYCLLFTKEAGNFVLGCTHFGEKAGRHHQIEKDECGIATELENEFLSGSSLPRTFSWSDRDDQGLLMIRMEEVGLRNTVAVASNRASLAASTGRKLHQWKAPEPYRVLEDGQADHLSSLQQELSFDGEKNEQETKLNRDDGHETAEVVAGVRMLDTDPMGDCFGFLGGKPLLARTKSIADVGDLRQIAAGENFFMAISSSGGLYSWESCPSGASCSSSTAPPLGRGCVTPERVPWFSSPEKVFRVACGIHHTLALTSSGLYAWGSNLYGQLGLGAHCSAADPHLLEPALVSLSGDCTPVVDVACGEMHSVVLSASGMVCTFGCNWEGQLGIDEAQLSLDAKVAELASTGCAYEPLTVNLTRGPETNESKRAYLIAAGLQTTAAVATTGQVFQWGKCVPNGIDGVCGRINRWLPEELEAISEYDAAPAKGPVWHSIAIADGLVVLTKYATLNNTASEDSGGKQ
ncbi:putative E3 ubiquitin-protein ligase herc3 [Phytophthora pseudosyringae]|uniref:Putative E3 ubiquitin-protein ligase herc3 n=1 Tax=Phytophthora pseudosyringae TaxID=221518 RepID=A0A8T1V6Q0_9STRA|nr:putative E3 ubiquitin-protein ligase herc3 [Phytophthora pseudosyringae]